MKDLSVADLINLVVSDASSPEDRLEKVFEWQHSRDLEIVKWLFGAGVSLFIAIAISSIRDQQPISWPQVGWITLGPLGLLSVGMAKLYIMRRSNRTYLAAIGVLCRIKTIRPFLLRYFEHV